MDLLMIARKLWRYKLLTLPVLLLTLCGAAYVVVVKTPVYETSSSYVIVNPPSPPTEEDVARNPALGHINADNPFARFSDDTVIVDVLASKLANESAEQALLKEGADPRYEVESSSALGYSSPILKITAQGESPRVAVRSAKLVGSAVIRELERMQKAEAVDPTYWIKAQQLDAPDGAELRASGQLRMLVGVLALGAVLLFVVVSVADALTSLRRERGVRAAPRRLAMPDEFSPAYDGRAEGLSEFEPDDWSELDAEPADSDGLINLFPDRDPGAAVRTRRKQRSRKGA
jgi:capsular polysaccharide biosynthesis protein